MPPSNVQRTCRELRVEATKSRRRREVESRGTTG